MSALRLVSLPPPAPPAHDPANVPRVPEELFGADFPDWVKMVWLAVRKVQGNNAWAWAMQSHYSDVSGKTKAQVSKALKILVSCGWIEEGEGRRIRCRIGQNPEGGEVAQQATLRTVKPVREVAQQATRVAQQATRVAQQATPSESSQESRKESGHGGPAGPPRESAPPVGPDPLGFDAFWEAYGRKEKRAKTAALWARLPARTRRAIMDHLPGFVASTPEVRFRPHPLTYLHGERWKDEALPPAPIPKPVRPPVDLSALLLPADRDRAIAETPGLSPADFVLASTDSRTGLGLYRLSSAARTARGLPAPR